MGYALPLNEMTVFEKLQAIEEIWEDMQKNADEIPVPSWHLEVLESRERKIKEGTAKFIDLKDVKINIRNKIK